MESPIGTRKTRSIQEIGKAIDGIDWSKGATGQQLRELYEMTMERADAERAWYDNHETKYLRWSNALRILAALLLGASILCPLIALQGGFEKLRADFLTGGYIAAVVGGLLLSYDRFFLVTENWMVFTQMMLALEARIEAFRYEWLKSTIGLAGPIVDTDKAKELIGMCQRFVAEVLKEVETETQRWRVNLEKAARELTERVGKAAEEALKQKTEAAEASKTGDVQVKVTGLSPAHGVLKILVDGELRDTLQHPKVESHVRGLIAGVHEVLVRGESREGRSPEIPKLIVIKAGEVVPCDFAATELWKTGSVRVKLTGGTDKTKIKVAVGGKERDFTDPNWEWLFEDLPSGKHVIQITGDNQRGQRIDRRDEVEIRSGETKELPPISIT